jgi:hypothetical protein
MISDYNYQDYAIIKANTEKIMKTKSHNLLSDSFTWFLLGTLFDIDEDEIHESITDTAYVGNHSGFDRGIDAIVIIDKNEKKEIHFLNIKYTDDNEKSKNNNFPSAEIDKLIAAIEDIFQLNIDGFKDCNPVLKDRINEVIDIIKGDPSTYYCYIHFSSNFFNGLVVSEYDRFKNRMNRFRNLTIMQDTLSTISSSLLIQAKTVVNGKVQYSQDAGFIRTDGNSRALIFSINAICLLSLVADSEDIRNDPNFDKLELLKEKGILEDAFEMNIRKYQKNRNRINRNIINTVISDERQKVFYYNNGITMMCDKFEYGDTKNTVLSIQNMQIVNGCQTVHSLFEAFLTDAEKLKNVDVLCRLYEINNEDTYSKIAEFTNSQTPVTGRDLRSNDEIQRKLEAEFLALGYLYERKKFQYLTGDPNKIVDSEKVGQLLMAFNNDMPGEAKNMKAFIFGKEYENLFTETLTAKEILRISFLYNKIENKRKKMEVKIKANESKYEKYHFLIYASYYILFVISSIMRKMHYHMTISCRVLMVIIIKP